MQPLFQIAVYICGERMGPVTNARQETIIYDPDNVWEAIKTFRENAISGGTTFKIEKAGK